MCIDYLKNPNEAVEEIAGKEMLEGSVGILALASVIFAVDGIIGIEMLRDMALTVQGPEVVLSLLKLGQLNLAVELFAAVLVGGLFFGWITKLIMNLLGAEGSYFDGLTTIAYPVLAVSVGILLAMLFSYIPLIGTVLSFIAVAVFFTIGYASLYRFAKELFDTDMITAFVGISVLMAIVVVSIYGALATTTSGLQAIAPAS